MHFLFICSWCVMWCEICKSFKPLDKLLPIKIRAVIQSLNVWKPIIKWGIGFWHFTLCYMDQQMRERKDLHAFSESSNEVQQQFRWKNSMGREMREREYGSRRYHARIVRKSWNEILWTILSVYQNQLPFLAQNEHTFTKILQNWAKATDNYRWQLPNNRS